MVDDALKVLVEKTLREIMPGMIRQAVREVLNSAPSKSEANGYLTTAEAADWARVNPATIRQWINKGYLARHQAGRVPLPAGVEQRRWPGGASQIPQ